VGVTFCKWSKKLSRKFFNLIPEDLPKIIQRSRLVYHDGKWKELMPTSITRTPSGSYNFVTQDGDIFISKVRAIVDCRLIGHIDLSMGKEVDYAGRVYFSGRKNRGILRKWTNESGHYRPSPDFISAAGLPISQFQPGSFK
jgi:hypothetical protein